MNTAATATTASTTTTITTATTTTTITKSTTTVQQHSGYGNHNAQKRYNHNAQERYHVSTNQASISLRKRGTQVKIRKYEMEINDCEKVFLDITISMLGYATLHSDRPFKKLRPAVRRASRAMLVSFFFAELLGATVDLAFFFSQSVPCPSWWIRLSTFGGRGFGQNIYH